MDVKALSDNERKDAALILRRLSQPCPSGHDADTCPRCLTIESLAHHSGRIFDLLARAAETLAAPRPSGETPASGERPAIEVGDVVATIAGNAELVTRSDAADYWNDRRPELMRDERIAAIYRDPLWRRS